jgi:hypothetical protein
MPTAAKRQHRETSGHTLNVERVDYRLTGITEVSLKDLVRKVLATRLLWLLIGTIAGGSGLILYTVIVSKSVADVRGYVEMVFTAVTTLVSTVVGFYFGSESARPATGASSEEP